MAVDAWLVLLENNLSEGKNGMSRDGMGGGMRNQNALKHERYSAEAIAQRRKVAALLRACRDQLGAMCEL